LAPRLVGGGSDFLAGRNPVPGYYRINSGEDTIDPKKYLPSPLHLVTHDKHPDLIIVVWGDSLGKGEDFEYMSKKDGIDVLIRDGCVKVQSPLSTSSS